MAISYAYLAFRNRPRAPGRAHNRAFNKAGSGFPVGNHNNLLHLFSLCLQDAAGKSQPFSSVRVVRADLGGGKFCQRQFFCAVVEQDDLQGIAGILGLD